jgi:hypothetical protein
VAVPLTDRLEEPGYGLGVALMLVGWTFGLITLAVRLWRAWRVPGWGARSASASRRWCPRSRIGVAVGFLVLLAGFAAAARARVREDAPAENRDRTYLSR